MEEIGPERQRRIGQFEKYLRIMQDRSRSVGRSCFLCFEEPDDDAAANDPALVEAQELVHAASSGLAGNERAEVPPATSEPTEGRGSRSPLRFVQFQFAPDIGRFIMDMPRQCLLRPEAEKIQRDRAGFFYLAEDDPEAARSPTVQRCNPFEKEFLYGDERSAAEDTAYVFFDVWRFAPDALFLVTAFAKGGPTWESGLPIR